MSPGNSGNQTITQQNLPDWAIDYGQNTLDMAKYYTNNQNYRPSTLDRDYSGIRGYNAEGQPNSQVGQFGLNPMPAQPQPQPQTERGAGIPTGGLFGSGLFGGVKGQVAIPTSGLFGGGFGGVKGQVSGQNPMPAQTTGQNKMTNAWSPEDGPARSTLLPDGSIDTSQYGRGLKMDDPFFGTGRKPGSNVAQPMPAQRPLQSPLNWNQPTSRGMGRVDTTNSAGTEGSTEYESEGGYTGPGWDLDGDGKGYYYDGDGANNNSNSNSSSSSSSSGNTNNQTTLPAGMSQEEVQALIDQQLQQFDENTITPDEMPTPFQAYDRQRFAAPGENTLRGEGILAGRYDQRFGLGGTNPFAAATTAVDKAANYQSGFQGTTGGIGGQAGNYQAGLATATNPGVFSGSTDYKTGLDTKFSNPNAGMQNVNAGLRNVNAGLQNVNAGLRSATYGNANQGLQAPVNYQQQKTLRDSMQQFQDPYTDRVVNQTIKDMDRARQMTANQISGDSAKAGAFGGSRSMLMQAENNRNFADRTAAAVGQLRSQGFQRAADLAQQENLQRLGLSASDVQQARGLQSQGNLQGQNLTANDLQNVRALQSQGALTAQSLQSQGALAAQGLQSQGALAAQGLRSQGALAALNANANLYGQGLSLGAGMDQAALQANAGLLSDAMSLDAADLNQRRSLASNEAQFAENASQNAGALNLQGGQALSQLAQAGTADERQRIADLLASGQAGDARNQQDLDFIYGEFNRELAYPGQQIDLRNAAISPATGSIVTTTQPRYEQNPLLAGLGAGVSTYALAGNPYLAGAAGLLSYMNS